MPINPDIRWKQRFESFNRAYNLLSEALQNGPSALPALEKEGVIQRFEYSLELAWKTVKDYLEEGGRIISPVTPRQVLKEAFAAKIISDGQVWMDMLYHRNLLSQCAYWNQSSRPICKTNNMRTGQSATRTTLCEKCIGG